MTKRYEPPAAVYVADPPWQFRDTLPGAGRGAAKHYRTGKLPEIALAMKEAEGKSRAVLFLWRVAAMQADAFALARILGFTVKSELVWYKHTTGGKPHFGMGHYTRAAHETCLICTRGPRVVPATRSQRSVFSAPVGRHSEKPAAFYRIVEEMYPDAPLVEFFARTVRAGWTQHGDELEAA